MATETHDDPQSLKGMKDDRRTIDAVYARAIAGSLAGQTMVRDQ
jgi:hypothetical protein